MGIATYTLAAFLKKTGLLDYFRSEVAPHLLYLRSVLGDGFFTDATEGKAFRSQVETSLELQTEEYASYSPEDSKEVPFFVEDWEVSEIEKDLNRERRTKERSLHRMQVHLFHLERILLGSMRAGDRFADVRGPNCVIIGDKEITPFPSLLGSNQLWLGKGGLAGGFRARGKVRYASPHAGESRFLHRTKLESVIAELADGGVVPRRDLIVLVGEKLLQIPCEDIQHGEKDTGEAPLFTQRYGGKVDSHLQPKLAFSPFMPDNAIYIINPKKVFIHAPRICGVKAREEDDMLTSTSSYLAHSLLHSIDQSGSENLERHHYAFLGVEPKGLPPTLTRRQLSGI